MESTKLNKKLVSDYIVNIINTGEIKAIATYISEDYKEVYNGKVYEMGIEGAIEHVNGVHKTYSKLKLKVLNQWCDGDYVITQYVMTGIHTGTWMEIKPTHKPIEIHGINIDKVVDGKIVEHGGSANLLEPLLNIGGISVNKD